MAQNVQTVMAWNATNEVRVVGSMNVSFSDIQFGTGSTTGPILFNGDAWLRLNRLASGNTLAGNAWLLHNYLHPWLDPASNIPYKLRFEDVVMMDWGSSTTARAAYGFLVFPTVTDPASLRGIGFYADSNGNWFALVADASGDRLRADTGVSTASLARHHLECVIDFATSTITFYIDGNQVAQVILTTPLDQFHTNTGTGSGISLGQVIQSNVQAADMYFGGGFRGQLQWVSDEADAAAGAGWSVCPN